MKNAIAKVCLSSAVTMTLLACSGGGSGGAGGGGGSSSILQSSKMSCNGATCIGNGSLSAQSHDQLQNYSVDTAVSLYNLFNNSMIPALNDVIGKVEAGVAQGGAESCADIEIPFAGQVTVGGTLYNVKTMSASASAPSDFTTTTMQKGLAGQVASNSENFIQGDVACGLGTNQSPLVARVLAKRDGMQLNSWFEKGDSNHIRILMVVNTGTLVIGAWFKTDDGDNFQLVLASNGTVYKAVGSKTLGSIKYSEGGADICLNATTGASATNCDSLASTSTISVTGLPNTLVSSTTAWASITNSTTLNSPAF